ncbi:MAG: SMP-30/gluconolactonase/LRE family protein [Acidimicrobiaceae bacterium]|nr:SMP-30/gluconolactonase/LRE family protein [Acidimicrobiaceae bacterium]
MTIASQPILVKTERVTLDDRFRSCRTDPWLEVLYRGCRWAEGPAWFGAGRYLVWSDIPNNRMLRWDEVTGTVGVFRQPSGHANGNTVDAQGRLVSCEHGNRRVTRTEHDGFITVLADRYQGLRFNSPNDVVVRSDGSIWFTDPSYGISSYYEGDKAESEIGANHVYRVDPTTGACRAVTDDFEGPNGLAFSPDEQTLYICDSTRRHLRSFTVQEDGSLSGGAVLATCTEGTFDGFRLDDEGRIWTSAGDGVHCYHPDGTLIGKVLVPETVSNVAFGGSRRNQLFITATTSLYTIHTGVRAAA